MKIKKRKDGIDRSILKDFMKSSIKYSSIDVKSMKKFNENQKKKKGEIKSILLFWKISWNLPSIKKFCYSSNVKSIENLTNEDKKKKRKEGEKEMQKLEVT